MEEERKELTAACGTFGGRWDALGHAGMRVRRKGYRKVDTMW